MIKYAGKLTRAIQHNMDLGNIGFYNSYEPEICFSIEVQLKAQNILPSHFYIKEVASFPTDDTETTWTTYITAEERLNPTKGIFYTADWYEVIIEKVS